MTLEEALYRAGFCKLVRILDAELTIWTKRGTYAVFRPRACLWVEDNKLALGHPMGSRLLFGRDEILAIQSGVSVSPVYPGNTYQRLIENLG